MYTYIYMYIYIYTYIHIHIYIYIHIHVYIHIHKYTYVYIHIHNINMYMYISIPIRIYIYIVYVDDDKYLFFVLLESINSFYFQFLPILVQDWQKIEVFKHPSPAGEAARWSPVSPQGLPWLHQKRLWTNK